MTDVSGSLCLSANASSGTLGLFVTVICHNKQKTCIFANWALTGLDIAYLCRFCFAAPLCGGKEKRYTYE